MFALYGSGQHSLNGVRNILKTEFGVRIAKGYLQRLLMNPFYKGQFVWEDKLYSGTQTPLVSAELFDQVQAVFRGHNKTKHRKHDFAFSGLLRCAYDNCMVTAEIQKNRYTYYHCTGFRGKCELPYFPKDLSQPGAKFFFAEVGQFALAPKSGAMVVGVAIFLDFRRHHALVVGAAK